MATLSELPQSQETSITAPSLAILSREAPDGRPQDPTVGAPMLTGTRPDASSRFQWYQSVSCMPEAWISTVTMLKAELTVCISLPSLSGHELSELTSAHWSMAFPAGWTRICSDPELPWRQAIETSLFLFTAKIQNQAPEEF